jgi:hypothetical protein
MIGKFLRQPNRPYRDMQVALGFLTLNFLVPSLGYAFAPDLSVAQFQQAGKLLGGGDYPFTEQSYLWRVLASGNVGTLAFLCFLLMLDVRRFAPVVPVFVVLKGWSAVGYLLVFLTSLHYPLFLAVFFWDGLALFLVVFMTRRALRAIEKDGSEGLVPPLAFSPRDPSSPPAR